MATLLVAMGHPKGEGWPRPPGTARRAARRARRSSKTGRVFDRWPRHKQTRRMVAQATGSAAPLVSIPARPRDTGAMRSPMSPLPARVRCHGPRAPSAAGNTPSPSASPAVAVRGVQGTLLSHLYGNSLPFGRIAGLLTAGGPRGMHPPVQARIPIPTLAGRVERIQPTL